jgi:hypothetical protein
VVVSKIEPIGKRNSKFVASASVLALYRCTIALSLPVRSITLVANFWCKFHFRISLDFQRGHMLARYAIPLCISLTTQKPSDANGEEKGRKRKGKEGKRKYGRVRDFGIRHRGNTEEWE